MFERILIGLVIGFVSAFAFKDATENSEQQNTNVFQIFVALIVLAFIGSSFMFGAIFGLMAIGEIAIGFWVAKNITMRVK
ncbi:hypothetical protein R7P75_23275 [Vibrio sp. 2175-1]|uniref:hypothetical protein n=1 Tax=Vibrio TaxID=662 RepID=UPI001CDD178E|nr:MULTISPECIES: hypothetical protein [Vibrio]MCA2494175.1 hypothetical protein [Vibrio alginolyticus]MDW2221137.1 hypothetical protein [Vibrio sp. 2175-1]HCG6407635.1 hypothetical protein [Vibrio parahaemolyticus]